MKIYHSIVRKVITASLAAAMLLTPTVSYLASPVTADAVQIDSSTMVSGDYVVGIYTATSNAKVRSGPGVAYEQLSTLIRGTKVTITEIENGWGYFFENESCYGWVSMTYMRLYRATSPHKLGTYRCTASTLNVRAGAAASYKSVGKLKEGDEVVLRLMDGDWGFFHDDNMSGWVSVNYLEYVSDAMEKFRTGTYAVTSDELNMRMGNGTAFDAVMPLYKNDLVCISKIIGDWGFTILDGKAGWVNLNYMMHLGDIIIRDEVDHSTEIVVGSTVMIKANARSYTNGKLSTWMYNAEFEVLSVQGDKVTIGLDGKRSGDMHIDNLVLLDSLYCCGDGAVRAYGMDVSRWQGDDVDWALVAASGIEFVILRIGTTEGIDKNFEKNYEGAKEAGLDVGVYLYTYASTKKQAIKDAQKCIQWLDGKKLEYPVFFDIEDTTQANFGKAKNTELSEAFISTMFDAGWYAGVYTAASWYDYNIDYVQIGSKYDAWVARYWDGTPSSKCEYGKKFGMYQYTQKGQVPGIEGDVDLDVSYKDFPSIIKNGGYSGYGSWDSANRGVLTVGDATGDNSVSMEDVTEIQRAIASLTELDINKEIWCDVNDDDSLNLEDVVLIQKYIAGLIEFFPAEE